MAMYSTLLILENTHITRYAGLKSDELMPVTNQSYNWMELSASCVSALDTMLIMNLTVEF